MNETKIIYDLVQKTRGEEIKWSKKTIFEEGYSNSRIVERYTAEHKGESLQLELESRFDTYDDTDYHKSVIHLWILDEKGEKLWKFPQNDAAEDLLSTVRFQTGRVAERLQKLMS